MLIAFMAFAGGMAVAQNPGAQTTPAQKTVAERNFLFDALRAAPTESAGQAIASQIWRFWLRQAPDEASAGMMAKAMERRRQYDFTGAMEYLDRLVAHAPDWPEAWNQRATVLYLQEKLDHSLDNVEKVLALEPEHFGALAGKAVILMRQGRIDLGQKALRQALAIHPWLSERWMLLPVAPSVDL
jgi:Tfp pilus assembly protein PilF